MIRKTLEDYHTLATKRGFKWLGFTWVRTTDNTTWQCSKGHTWEAQYNSLARKNKTGCPICHHIKRSQKLRKQPEDYHILAKERNFSWLGPIVSKVSISTVWRCNRDHTWFSTYMSIYSGTGCSICSKEGIKTGKIAKTSGRFKLTAINYYDMAEKYNMEWLGEEIPKTYKHVTTWLCPNGHRRQVSYVNISRLCSICVEVELKKEIDARIATLRYNV